MQPEPNSRNLILAAATGYSWPQIRIFFDSLARTSFSGTVGVLVHPGFPAELRQLRLPRVSIIPVQRLQHVMPLPLKQRLHDRRLGPLRRLLPRLLSIQPGSELLVPLAARLCGFFHHISCARYFYYRSILANQRIQYDRVLLTDIRDVFFQANPFQTDDACPLRVFLEHKSERIGDSQSRSWNSLWIKDIYGDDVINSLSNCRVSCSGTTIGSTAGILNYLDKMTIELIRATPLIHGRGFYDQGIHNRLIWGEGLPEAHATENGEGPVMTMNGVPNCEIRWNNRGEVINHDDTPVAVLHQYDRIPGLSDHLMKNFRGGKAGRAH